MRPPDRRVRQDDGPVLSPRDPAAAGRPGGPDRRLPGRRPSLRRSARSPCGCEPAGTALRARRRPAACAASVLPGAGRTGRIVGSCWTNLISSPSRPIESGHGGPAARAHARVNGRSCGGDPCRRGCQPALTNRALRRALVDNAARGCSTRTHTPLPLCAFALLGRTEHLLGIGEQSKGGGPYRCPALPTSGVLGDGRCLRSVLSASGEAGPAEPQPARHRTVLRAVPPTAPRAGRPGQPFGCSIPSRPCDSSPGPALNHSESAPPATASP